MRTSSLGHWKKAILLCEIVELAKKPITGA